MLFGLLKQTDKGGPEKHTSDAAYLCSDIRREGDGRLEKGKYHV